VSWFIVRHFGQNTVVMIIPLFSLFQRWRIISALLRIRVESIFITLGINRFWSLLVNLVIEIPVRIDFAFIEFRLERVVFRPLLHDLLLYQLFPLVINFIRIVQQMVPRECFTVFALFRKLLWSRIPRLLCLLVD